MFEQGVDGKDTAVVVCGYNNVTVHRYRSGFVVAGVSTTRTGHQTHDEATPGILMEIRKTGGKLGVPR
jgi:hypothetical protein